MNDESAKGNIGAVFTAGLQSSLRTFARRQYVRTMMLGHNSQLLKIIMHYAF